MLNALHPFRVGDARIQRLFLRQLAGRRIDWPANMAERNTDASNATLRGDSSGRAGLIGDSLVGAGHAPMGNWPGNGFDTGHQVRHAAGPCPLICGVTAVSGFR